MESEEAVTSGRVRKLKEFQTVPGIRDLAGHVWKSLGLPLSGGLGEQGTGRVLDMNNSSGP